MTQWWEGLSSFQQIMFMIAVPATIIMIILLILMLIGMDGAEFSDADVDIDGVDFINNEPLSGIGGLKIFTLRGSLSFLSIGGWVGFILADKMNEVLASLIGLVCGAIAAFLMALALKAAMKLESEGNLDYHNTIGKVGTIYIKVPAKQTGKGKITVTAQERFLEIDAVTNEEEDLKTGVSVEVVALVDESTVLIKKK